VFTLTVINANRLPKALSEHCQKFELYLIDCVKVSEEMRCRIHSYLSHGHVVVQSHYKAPLI